MFCSTFPDSQSFKISWKWTLIKIEMGIIKRKWKNQDFEFLKRNRAQKTKTTTNKNPFVPNEHCVAMRHGAKGRGCSGGKWRPWLFSKEANLSQPGSKSREQDLPTGHPERTVMTAGTEEVLGLWERELFWFSCRSAVFNHPASLLLLC